MKNTKLTQKRQNRKGFTLVELLVVIAIIASLAGLSYGPIMKHIETSARTEAVSNGKNIYSALLGFVTATDNEFPNAINVAAQGGAPGADSASYLSVLFSGGYIADEKYFYNKQNAKMGLASTTVLPDNNGTLTADECVWGYVSELGMSDGRSPILFDSSTDLTAFFTNSWKGKAIIISVDGGAKSYNISFTPPLDPADNAQNGTVEVNIGGTQADIAGLVPSSGVILGPGAAGP